MMDKIKDYRKMKTEQVSRKVLYALVGVAAVVFVLFYLVGYNQPYIFEPEHNAPLFTDAVLLFMYAVVLATVVCTAVSLVMAFRRRERGDGTENGVPAAKITLAAVALTVLTLGITFAFASTDAVIINGKPFADALWLRLTDMFIRTIAVMLAVAVVAVALSAAQLGRRLGGRHAKR